MLTDLFEVSTVATVVASMVTSHMIPIHVATVSEASNMPSHDIDNCLCRCIVIVIILLVLSLGIGLAKAAAASWLQQSW